MRAGSEVPYGPWAPPPSIEAARLLVDESFMGYREQTVREMVAQWIAVTGDNLLHARAAVLGGPCKCFWCKT